MSRVPQLRILYTRLRAEEKLLAEAARRRDIPVDLADVTDRVFGAGLPADPGDVVLARCVSHGQNESVARMLEARGIRAELSWHPRRSASLELARLRGVPWWVDPSEGSALRLGDETSQSLETFYGEVGSC